MSKPFGVIITIPKPKAVAARCTRFDRFVWDIPVCTMRDGDKCAGCQYLQKVVGKVEDIFPDPDDKT